MEKQALINPSVIEKSMTYAEYRNLIDDLFAQNKVTGDFMDNSETILGYTKTNIARMRRGDKTFKIKEALKALIESVDKKWIWLVITEGWCGDAAQIIPGIVHMAGLNPNIETRFILRDENPEIMDAYLTNGARSIPKLVVLNADTLEEIGNWGPRPTPAQEMIMEHKKQQLEYEESAKQLHTWYAKDKYATTQQEILEQIKTWTSK